MRSKRFWPMLALVAVLALVAAACGEDDGDGGDGSERIGRGELPLCGQHQDRAEAPPRDCREVPGEAQGAPSEIRAAEKPRQVVAPEETLKKVALAQPGVRQAERNHQSGGEIEEVAHDVAGPGAVFAPSMNPCTAIPKAVLGSSSSANC